jgi:hypothetical protein
VLHDRNVNPAVVGDEDAVPPMNASLHPYALPYLTMLNSISSIYICGLNRMLTSHGRLGFTMFKLTMVSGETGLVRVRTSEQLPVKVGLL